MIRRPPKRIIALVVLLAALAYLFLRDSGFVRISQLRWERHRLENEIVVEKVRRDSLVALEFRLRNDTTALEKVAREKLGMAREDETVYKFVDPKKKEK